MKTRFVQAFLVLGTLVSAAQAEIPSNRGQPNSAGIADQPEDGVSSLKSSRLADRMSRELPLVARDQHITDETEPSVGNQKPPRPWEGKSEHSEDEYVNLKYSVESRLAENFQDAAEPAEVRAPAAPEVPEVLEPSHHAQHETYEHRYKHGVVPARLPAQENDRAHRFRHSIIHGYGDDIHA